MPLDISLILRKWAFDLDSEALGPIRIANADIQKIFNENEAAIRASELEGAQLARVLFEQMAHKRTGNEAVDKMCGGPTFELSELDLLTSSELDLFADMLIKDHLRFVIPKDVASSKRTTETGSAALSGALIAFADANRASRTALTEICKKHFSAVEQIASQWKQTQSIAAGLGLTNSIVEAERARAEKWKSIAGVESIADKAVRDWKRQEEQIQAATGYGADVGLAKAIAQYERDQNLVAIAIGTIQSSALGFAGMSAAERIGMASGHTETIAEYLRENDLASKTSAWVSDAFQERDITVREITAPVHVFRPPPNPIHQTNKIMEELLYHQKEEAVKKEAENVTTNESSTSGLLYTKRNFWAALVAVVFTFAFGTFAMWGYFEQKAVADAAKIESAESARVAAENARAAFAESAKQRTEIRELTAALRKSVESKPSGHQRVKVDGHLNTPP